MTGGSRILALVAALLLVAGLAACGGGDGSDSTSAGAGSQGQAADSSPGAAKQDGGEGGGGSRSGGSSGQGGSGGSSEGAGDFTPKHHEDSGGGSQQFEVKGGDNSVQEFGSEADASERDAAATALHNFFDARAEGEWAAACRYMAKVVTESLEKLAAQSKQVEGGSCAATLGALTSPAAKRALKAEAAEADVGSLRVKGQRSFVIFTGPEGATLAMPMIREGGKWKVASLTGVPLN